MKLTVRSIAHIHGEILLIQKRRSGFKRLTSKQYYERVKLKALRRGAPFGIICSDAPSLEKLHERVRENMSGCGTLTLMNCSIKSRGGESKTALQWLKEDSEYYFSVAFPNTPQPNGPQIAEKLKRGFWIDFILRKSAELYNLPR